MNILHLKYAVEVARCGSINKAAEALYMNQPNLSRAIKDLENSLGITIFGRTAKGMYVTPEGEEFLGYARKILRQIDEVESIYKAGVPIKQRFSISVPRASYISEAFAQFSKSLTNEPAELFYKETNAQRVITNILKADYHLGILRYASNYDKYFKEMLTEKGLVWELITEFRYVLAMSKEHPLAKQDEVHFDDLKQEELPDETERRIFVFERASQFDLMAENHETYMWLSPVPQKLKDRYGLVEKNCPDNKKTYRDLLIYRKDYHLSDLDRRFITELCLAKRQYI